MATSPAAPILRVRKKQQMGIATFVIAGALMKA